MPPEVQSEIADLRERVRKLEEAAGRTKRGRTNMLGAAQYLGKSREWLRKLHLRGGGPHRAPDGTYSFDDLDAFSEKTTQQRSPPERSDGLFCVSAGDVAGSTADDAS